MHICFATENHNRVEPLTDQEQMTVKEKKENLQDIGIGNKH